MIAFTSNVRLGLAALIKSVHLELLEYEHETPAICQFRARKREDSGYLQQATFLLMTYFKGLQSLKINDAEGKLFWNDDRTQEPVIFDNLLEAAFCLSVLIRDPSFHLHVDIKSYLPVLDITWALMALRSLGEEIIPFLGIWEHFNVNCRNYCCRKGRLECPDARTAPAAYSICRLGCERIRGEAREVTVD